MRRFGLLFALCALSASPLAGQTVLPQSEPLLLPGDQLQLVIWRNSELSGTYTVGADSTLLHPLFAELRVGGRTVAEAHERIADFLRRFEADPVFMIEPRHRVYVGGVVGRQGEYFLRPTTVGQAITEAGGATTPNPRLRVRLIRDGVETVADLEGGAETALLQTRIRSGDQILVDERPSFRRNILNPTLQAIQTITGLIATYVYLDAIFGAE